MERKTGWYYVYSKELDQEIALSKKTGWVFCKDGTKYSPAEVEILRSKNGITKEIHLLKKTFEGSFLIEDNQSKNEKKERQAVSDTLPDIY
ncbi:MAG: hypothetical protein ACRC4W_06070 [Treponemataceae bacterium]